jgi:hypothetical protein
MWPCVSQVAVGRQCFRWRIRRNTVRLQCLCDMLLCCRLVGWRCWCLVMVGAGWCSRLCEMSCRLARGTCHLATGCICFTSVKSKSGVSLRINGKHILGIQFRHGRFKQHNDEHDFHIRFHASCPYGVTFSVSQLSQVFLVVSVFFA